MHSQQSFKREDIWSGLPPQTIDLTNSLANVNFKRSDSQRSPKLLQNQTRYKTEICRSYEESGICKYGDKCQFAHGQDEVRTTNRHPKYKTQMCRTFHSWGYCRYGPRCHFIHNEDAETLDIARGLSPQSPSSPYSPNGSPISSPYMFFNEEDHFSCQDQFIDCRLSNNSLFTAAPMRQNSHRRLPVFALLNTGPIE
ncbi:Protein TIS11 isoform X10 [Oopsacas minuta]|uniref:Protein TIS11 isoform X10 n=1 Tax=Oopsacas minuta TaxID=111878 RepID=A0AAV7JDA4_9METZ|nr:Protein TIS11 isoform X10 [Oopsacas minuta]